MRRLLFLLPISVCLVAQATHTQWLGIWKLRTVTPTDDPGHVAKESTAVLTESNGKFRRVETGTHLNGQPFKSDSGWVRWDGAPQRATSSGGAFTTIQVQDVDRTHQVVTVKMQSGPTIIIHGTLSENAKTITQVEDVMLPDGRSRRYTSIWDKQ